VNAVDTENAEQYSFSRLEKYAKCSYKYWLHYFKPVPRPFTGSVATEAGTVVHTVLDRFADPNGYNRTIPTVELLNHYWYERLKAEGIESAFYDLLALAHDYNNLLLRATFEYTGPDRIRDSNGKVSKQFRKTPDWNAAYSQLAIDARSRAINDVAARVMLPNEKTGVLEPAVWAHVQLTEVFAKSYRHLQNYRDTMGWLTMYVLEMPISRDKKQNRVNTVYYPGTNIEFTGFIDVIALDQSGAIYVIDHKTNKDKPDSNKVAHWEQLIIYGWAMHQIWGVYPKYMGINWLGDPAQLVVAEFDPALIPGALQRAMGRIRGVQHNLFIQHNPTDYNNACYNKYSEDNACEYLSLCHPRFAKAVGLYVPTWEVSTV
jgi:hypothetical protein